MRNHSWAVGCGEVAPLRGRGQGGRNQQDPSWDDSRIPFRANRLYSFSRFTLHTPTATTHLTVSVPLPAEGASSSSFEAWLRES
jgi:hypothetical protein